MLILICPINLIINLKKIMYTNYTKDVKKLFFYNIRCMDTHDHDESMTDVMRATSS
jgi:hypothetical protein